MPNYDKTLLWQRSLAAKVDDEHKKEREKLRAAYENVRERAIPLAEAIARDLPEFTIHDISHADALWQYADLICGPDYVLNPCEGFVLGCAFLIHDLGMGLSAYPGGVEDIKKLPGWKDTLASILRKEGIEDITEEISSPSEEILNKAVCETLRTHHAKRSSKLAFTCWQDGSDGQQFHLIEDVELREAFGSIIGRIAASHSWPIERVAKEFHAIMGAHAGFSQTWTVDALKLACVLRSADYAHVDDRRAPIFLKSLQKPSGVAEQHWKFQGKLYQPRIEGDRLIYTAKSGFTVEEASAWWLCYDTLVGIDSELRRVDALLADTKRARFVARGVSQVEEPSRLANLIVTDGWQPVNAKIRVSAVAELVAKLGGADLYGDKVTPPLREMMQNAADAVRARRILDNRPADWGEIRISTGVDGIGFWLQIEDAGVGMSEAVLTGPLLDFGTSFWSSDMVNDQLPGLIAKGFRAAGKYGIGFFSLFMWGERVQITSQRFDSGREDTRVLSFRRGLAERPILRKAVADEYILDGGTRIKVWFSEENTFHSLFEAENDSSVELKLTQVCANIAPCLDVTVKSSEMGEPFELALTAGDWLTMPDDDLYFRIKPVSSRRIRRYKKTDGCDIPPLKTITDKKGKIWGRIALWNRDEYDSRSEGITSVGGFRSSSLSGIVGVLVGESGRAARDIGIPSIPIGLLREWASSEASKLDDYSDEDMASVALILCELGLPTEDYPIAFSSRGWIKAAEVCDIAEANEELLILDPSFEYRFRGGEGKFKFNNNVILISTAYFLLNYDSPTWVHWPEMEFDVAWGDKHFYMSRSLMGGVVRKLAARWNVTVEAVLSASSLDYDDDDRRNIGSFGGESFVENVQIFRRPKV